MKKYFWIDSAIATLFIFLLMGGIYKLTQLKLFDAFDSIGQALEDVDMTDYVFSQFRKDPGVDTNIVVINIGNLSRRDVARQIDIISQYKPKVIGMDGFYNCQGLPRDTISCPELIDYEGNLMLRDAIKRAGNVVLVTKLLQSFELERRNVEDEYDSLERSDSLFTAVAFKEGYASLETEAAYQDDVKTCRSFNPKMDVNGEEHLAFSVQMAMLYDSAKTLKFLARNNFSEVINYRGNAGDFFSQNKYPLAFYALDIDNVFEDNFLPSMIEGKVVVFGFMGKEFGDPSWSDKFFTPLNLKLAGKANPDMFGVTIHANIVSMILREEYIDTMDEWQEWALAIILCYLNVALFSLIYFKLPEWYDGITKLIQVVELVILTLLMVEVFDLLDYKFDPAITLAAIALVGDSYEVYEGVIKNSYRRLKSRLFTKKGADVLTSDNQ
ncbi:MAG: CHASE2 domain-containing protein [Cyclobacteriaceae bacterium]|nr:CHASE2 domain-containing protein [Cyclobacteriaceae bacterium]